MRIRAKQIGIGIVVFNVGLVLLTLGLTFQAQMQNPMSGALVDVDGVNMHVIDMAPDSYTPSNEAGFDALVLIHGASTSALDFASNLLPELSDRYRVLAIDRPGHGYSERGSLPDMYKADQQANVILSTLAEMQIKSPVIVGHSWAGSVVLAALLAKHDGVKPVAGVLIAAETHPYEQENSLPTKLALQPYYGPIFRWQYLTPIGRMAIAPTVAEFFAPDEVPDNYVKETGLNLSLRPNVYLYNSQDRSTQGSYLAAQSESYSKIESPILSIYASEDHVVPPANHHDRLIADVPEVKSMEIVGAGHSPHHTRTDEVIDAIVEFVEELN